MRASQDKLAQILAEQDFRTRILHGRPDPLLEFLENL